MKLGMAINGTPDSDRKSCFDCNFCQASQSWWCVNEKAVEERGTKLPGIIKCPHWKPMVTEEELYNNATFFSKLFGTYKSGYIEVDLSENEKN
ncbi:hypothetical protein CVD28_02760 [Bacillus sp. M6-12]|uniref:hypothetical protein n=1 Tax=Bacillus sp. M6-12 TaxID=2054166 RepID=UPI000C76DB49|nr:hypothetical protein [Bacillus sp. M6-12]PLS19353.1 hypothetical protein CVD28_02760 [Bacillus sp. M6-12]